MHTFRNHLAFVGLAALIVFASAFWVASLPGQQDEAGAVLQDKSEYVGAAKCKNCHKAEDKGAIYDIWEKSPHAKAFETLGTDKAKEIAQAKGIENPQKAPECLKCHVTAHGVDEKKVNKSFKADVGIQCETCHGPGSEHMKARMKAAMKGEGKDEPGPLAIPAGEMSMPNEATCKACHNPESPTYTEFVLKERLPKIRHMHPNREKPRWLAPEEKWTKAADAGN